jgi:AcrR family transcriptional regulator
MPRVKPEHKEYRRTQVLAAARVCFARQGFHRTTLQDVFAEAGLSAGCVYSYFQSKDDLILAIAEERHAAERAILADGSAESDAVEALRRVAHRFADDYLSPLGGEKRQVAIQTWSEAMRSDAVLASVRAGFDAPRHAIAALVRRAKRARRLDRKLDADAVARSIVALFHGFVLQLLWEPDLDRAACLAVFDRFLDSLASAGKDAAPSQRGAGAPGPARKRRRVSSRARTRAAD